MDIVQKIEIITSDEVRHNFAENVNWSIIAQFPGCQVFDLIKYLNVSPRYVRFFFNKIEGIFVSIHVEDRYMTLAKRSLKSQTIDYEGAQMHIENLSLPKYKRFYLSLSQTTNLEMDSGVNCKNYPTKEFSSYQECDESFVYNEMRKVNKIMPFWAARTLNEVTSLT